MNLEKTETAPRASAWAWGLCWLMFGSTILNYMDRQTISLVSEQIRASFAIKEYVDFGWVISSFFMTYALFQVPAGIICRGGCVVVAGRGRDVDRAQPGMADRLPRPSGSR
jgi:MFS family permease